MNDNEPQHEISDYSGEFTEDGVTVLLDIFRIEGSTGGWTLQVIDQDDGMTIWEEPFETEKAAFEEFLATIERDGIRSFLDDPGIDEDEPAPTVQ